jgi:hypothetical protein
VVSIVSIGQYLLVPAPSKVMTPLLFTFARESSTTKGHSFGHQIGTKNGYVAWNEPPGADQVIPLPHVTNLAPNISRNAACSEAMVAIQPFFAIPAHAAADLTSSVKTPKYG